MINQLGINLKRCRKLHGWTQDELGIRAGVNMWTISKIEKGNVKAPRLDTILGLAQALGVSLDYLTASGTLNVG